MTISTISSKKGFLVFADVLWFLIYLLIVLLLYLFLFREMTPKTSDIVARANITNDAAFIAQSVLHMDQGPNTNAKFINAVRESALQKKKTASYEKFINEQFGYRNKDQAWHHQLQNSERRKPIAYGFVIGTVLPTTNNMSKIQYFSDTCITEEDLVDGEDLCSKLSFPLRQDPDTDLLVPRFEKRTARPEEQPTDLEVEVGTSYVLADGDGFVFQVIVLYKRLTP